MCMLTVRHSYPFSYNLQKIFSKYSHFVDIENLLVHHDFPMITGLQNDDIVIPCKPTSKNVAVKLIKDGDEVNNYVRMLSIFVLFLQEIIFWF